MENELTNLKITMTDLKKDICWIKKGQEKNDEQHKEIIGKIDNFVEASDKRFVTKESFRPIQKIVYGLVGAVLIAVLAAILALILKK